MFKKPLRQTVLLNINISVMLGNYLQQTTSADVIFSDASFLGALKVKANKMSFKMV